MGELWFKTEKRFAGRNVDLSLLGQWIERFFRRRDFRTSRETEEKSHRIIAQPTYVHEILDRTTVSISGNSGDFVVRFYTGARSEALMKFGLLTSLFGGGIAFLRGVKSDEAEEKLERDFWIYLEEKIDFLDDSAEKAESSSGKQ